MPALWRAHLTATCTHTYTPIWPTVTALRMSRFSVSPCFIRVKYRKVYWYTIAYDIRQSQKNQQNKNIYKKMKSLLFWIQNKMLHLPCNQIVCRRIPHLKKILQGYFLTWNFDQLTKFFVIHFIYKTYLLVFQK